METEHSFYIATAYAVAALLLVGLAVHTAVLFFKEKKRSEK